MKLPLWMFLLGMLVACSEGSEQDTAQPSLAEAATTRSSFNIRHAEIRHDTLVALEQEGIEFWINDDNSIGYYLADGKAIDNVYANAVGAYAARN